MVPRKGWCSEGREGFEIYWKEYQEEVLIY